MDQLCFLCRVSRRENEGRTLHSAFEENAPSCPFSVLALCLFSLRGPDDVVSSSHGEPRRLAAHLGVLHSVIACWMHGWCPKAEMS